MIHSETLITDAVAQILASPAPVLFTDTCFLVDIIRIPIRVTHAAAATRTLDAAHQLVAQAGTSPSNLWIIIPPLVAEEWTEHSDKTVEELKKSLQLLDNTIQVAHATAKVAQISLSTANIYSDLDIDTYLKDLSAKFLNSSIHLAQSPDIVGLASQRAIRGEAPSRKGDSQIKDCVIIEHSVALCTELRKAGFANKCVFATSNTIDFCTDSATPKEPLQSQLQSIDLLLTTNWEWTKTELGI